MRNPDSTIAPFPNRALGMAHALTSWADEYNNEVMALVALANLKPGEVLRLGSAQFAEVVAITKSTLTLQFDDGTRKRYCVNSKVFDQLVRDLGGMLLSAAHGVDAGDLVAALRRDPACRCDENGILCLSSGLPERKQNLEAVK